jgi:hypothetical protein
VIRGTVYVLSTIAAAVFIVLWWPFRIFMSEYREEDDELVVDPTILEDDPGRDVDEAP